jgi:hypothetical protein
MRSGWLGAALFLTTLQAMLGQSEPSMPAWLANYPGVTAQTTRARSLVESSYTAPARPDAVGEHYRKLFEAQNLPFAPNFDGMGTVVRAAAPECDLMISIRAQGAGTSVRVDCTGNEKSAGTWTATSDSSSKMPTGFKTPTRMTAADMMERQQAFHDKIFQPRPAAPAPALVWPEWLTHVNGRRLAAQAGVDQSGNKYLKGTYVTSTPMSAIHAFYEDLLKDNGYPVHSGSLSTGHTTSGIQQNALGHVEGHNYPNGSPGPYTEIRVSYSRDHLNDPITVTLRFTTYAYKGWNP